MSFFRKIGKALGRVAAPLASLIPGPIGAVARVIAPALSRGAPALSSPANPYIPTPSPVFGSGFVAAAGPVIARGATAAGRVAGRIYGYTTAQWRKLSPAQRAAIAGAAGGAIGTLPGGAPADPFGGGTAAAAPRRRRSSTRVRRTRRCAPARRARRSCAPPRRRRSRCAPRRSTRTRCATGRVSFTTRDGRRVSFTPRRK